MARYRAAAAAAVRIAAGAVAILWAGLCGSAFGQAPGSGGGPPPAVTVTSVRSQEITSSTEFLGRVQAIQSVDIRARVEGFLHQVSFEEGQDVRKGALLYVIEPAQYEAALASAKAQLQSAQASLLQAKQNLERQQELRRRGTVAEATLEQAVAQRDKAQADVAAAKAAVRTAELNLGYTHITSPIDGRIGATAITVGNLVGPSTGVLATVIQLDPIRVVFSVNERDLLTVKRRSQGESQQQINNRFVPSLRLPDGTMYGPKGSVDFVNNRVDPQTGTIGVYASFPNADKLLLPGMLVTVLVRPEATKRGLVVPLAAVQQDRQGSYVLVVGDDNRVTQQRIKTGQQIGENLVVTQGLREGEDIIVQGLQKVRPGQIVKPVPAATPSTGTGPAAQPAPANAPNKTGR